MVRFVGRVADRVFSTHNWASGAHTPVETAEHLFLFALPNQNADHSAPERIGITVVGNFHEALVAVQTVVMQFVARRPSFIPN